MGIEIIGVNKNDLDAMDKVIESLCPGKALVRSYELGYVRATHDIMGGKLPEPTHQVAYEDMGNPDKPFKFYSKEDADSFAVDLAMRNFINVKVSEVVK